tara:strand:- start:144 stop:449 length:306 start_codon:yes stop_codon:yes gene_type:complete
MENTQQNNDFYMAIKEKTKKYSKKIFIVVATIILVNFAQWISIQFLHTYCSKPGFWGMVENILSLGSPICHFVNNIQYNLSNYYVQLWLTSGLSLLGLLSI